MLTYGMRKHIKSLMNSQHFASGYLYSVESSLVLLISMLLCDAFRPFMKVMPYWNFTISCFCVKTHVQGGRVPSAICGNVASYNFSEPVADIDDYSHEINVLTIYHCPDLHQVKGPDQSAGGGELLTACVLSLWQINISAKPFD